MNTLYLKRNDKGTSGAPRRRARAGAMDARPCAGYSPAGMQPSDLRIALFSGNYNYVRDGANQALNRLMGHAMARGAQVRVYSPTTSTPAFEPTGDLVSVPALPMPGGRGEYRFALGLTPGVRRDLEAFAPNIIHCSAPELLCHGAIKWAERNGVAAVATAQTRFETYARYYGIGFLEPTLIRTLTRFYNRFDEVMTTGPDDGRPAQGLRRHRAGERLVARRRPCEVQSGAAQPRMAALARSGRRRGGGRLPRPGWCSKRG